MIKNLKGTMSIDDLSIGYDPYGNESGLVCGRIAVENLATLTVNNVGVAWSTAEAAILQSTAEATTTIEKSHASDVPDDFEVLIYADVDLEDSDTSIKLSTDVSVLSEKAILVTEELTSGTMYETAQSALESILSNMKVYDITLELNGKTVQPEGKVKIYIPIPDDIDSSNVAVYRVDEDGTKTKYDVTVEDGYAIIETDHFSTYVIGEEETSSVSSTSSTSSDDELDSTPKTGVTNLSVIVCISLSIVSLIGLAVMKLKK